MLPRTKLFCRDHSLFVPSTSRSYTNVVWLDGGKAHVPYDLWPEFINAVSEDMKHLKDPEYIPSYACERPPDDPEAPRRLVFDIDFKSSTPLSEEYIQNVYLSIGDTLRACFPPHKFHTMFSIVLNSPVKKTKDGAYKNGIHVAVPNAILTKHQCRQVVRLLIVHLIERFGGDRSGPLENTFEDAIDDAIYTGGLRLPGSLKASHCKCNKRDRKDCELCFGRGISTEWRPYTFQFMLDAQGNILPAHNKTFLAFEHSIGLAEKINWVTMNAPGKELVKEFKYPVGAPQPYPSARKRGKKKLLSDKNLWQTECKSAGRRKNLTPILETRPIFNDVVECIRKSDPVYSRVFVTNVNQCSSGDYLVNVSGVGCHNCFMKGGMKKSLPHSSNRVWFLISNKFNRVYQHCYDPVCRGKSKFVSQPDPITKNRLFAEFNSLSSNSGNKDDDSKQRKKNQTRKNVTTEERKNQLLGYLNPNKSKSRSSSARKKSNPKKRPAPVKKDRPVSAIKRIRTMSD